VTGLPPVQHLLIVPDGARFDPTAGYQPVTS
jgi:hypothetical protein